jgi:hypothetical protein
LIGKLDVFDPNNDDFELWSPSAEREEQCLFGRQTLYHRRLRDHNCYIGEQIRQPHSIQQDCLCTDKDFEWYAVPQRNTSSVADIAPCSEFNHVRNAKGECVPIQGASKLDNEAQCAWGQDYWYEKTAYRKIPHSSCKGGKTLDQGRRHACPGSGARGFFFWAMVLAIPAILAGLFATWWSRRRAGQIRLGEPMFDTEEGWLGTLQSIPFFIIGVAGAAWARLQEIHIPYISDKLGSRNRTGYTYRALDDDAALLGDYGGE